MELRVAATSNHTGMLLEWLEAQASMVPRSFFAARDGSVQVAGASAAHVHSSENKELLPEISEATSERLRYVGGTRFDAAEVESGARAGSGGSSSGGEWLPFGRCFWMLPRLELSVGESPTLPPASATGDSAESTETGSSCVSVPLSSNANSGSDNPAAATLAVQLRWRAQDPGAWVQERTRALQALSSMRDPQVRGRRGSLPAVIARRSEAVPREDFEAAVQEAVKTFQGGTLSKVVLARRVLLELTHEVDPVSLLRQVVGSAYKRIYLFLVEPVRGAAFLSLSPERLCRVQGCDIWTEAVAGTWPISEFEKIGEAALLASSAKHSSEHQMVVDYICGLLSDVCERRHITVCDTHILKLKHLVHIKQSYHAIAKGGQGAETSSSNSKPSSLSDFFCRRMSPTPAVCGLPLEPARRFIRRVEPWDRGFYAAPCGIVSGRGSELIVALRSALLREDRKLFTYAGAGIVPGSNPAEEFAEISLKMRQFTEGLPSAGLGLETPEGLLKSLQKMPNLNSLWAYLVVEECVRCGVRDFVICPGSRSTPLVVAVARNHHTRSIVHHDERGAAFYALGWAKAIAAPVAVIVTSGTAVANLLPAAVEAAQACEPLLLLTADRPCELRDTGANQTITQPGIFGCYTRWAKDLEAPSVQFPAHALLSDVDFAVASATGWQSHRPGPVHLNFCFRENLAPDSGPVRGSPHLSSDWDTRYVDTPQMHRWTCDKKPWSSYASASASLAQCPVLDELHKAAACKRRIVLVVGSMRSPREVQLAEEISLRLQAATFADITSGMRQSPSVVNYADQLLSSPLLAGELLRPEVIVRLGGAVCSARLNAFVKAGASRMSVRVTEVPLRLDQDHTATHHLACSLQSLAEALASSGLERATGPPAFWKGLSDSVGEVIDDLLGPGHGLTEPFVARAVSRLLPAGSSLQISSSMPIRDLDFFAKPFSDLSAPPSHPPGANRGASGIDGVISTAAGFCHGKGSPATLVIGDVACLHDLNGLQQLSGTNAPALTLVLVNNGGGGIFSFLPIARHEELMSPFFKEPHTTDFSAVCKAFGVKYICCETAEDFEVAYIQRQRRGVEGACVIEARVSLSHEENVALHKRISKAVTDRILKEMLSRVHLGWQLSAAAMNGDGDGASWKPTLVLLHGWLGDSRDWAAVSQELTQAGLEVLAIDLPGHGSCEVGSCKDLDTWEESAFFSLQLTAEAIRALLERLGLERPVLVGYSLGGRVAMTFAQTFPQHVRAQVILSSNPGLSSACARAQRMAGDMLLASKLGAAESPEEMEAFLRRWYEAAIWGGLAERRPEVHRAILSKRREACPRGAQRALLGMSLAQQQDLWPTLLRTDGAAPVLWYAYGGLDEKFAALGEKLQVAAGAMEWPKVRVFAATGHALVEERPGEVATLCSEVCQQLLQQTPSPVAASPQPPQLRLTAAWLEPIELKLKAPLRLSRGDPMLVRTGALVILQAEIGGTTVAGVGEVSPLPMFHQESLAQAQKQLSSLLLAWNSGRPCIPLQIARLDGGMRRWLEANSSASGTSLLPSVHSGLEMALLHLLSRAAGEPHLGAIAAKARQANCSAGIGINGLVSREEDISELSDGPLVVKVKVGKDPLTDAQRTSRLAELLQQQMGPAARLRLDANQAWSVQEAALFANSLPETALSVIEYWEEPIAPAGCRSLGAGWLELSAAMQGRVQLAVDESLTEGSVQLEDLAAEQVPLAAVILKPSLQGQERTLELAQAALALGARPVISSAFESGVALCHLAILAASLAPQPWQLGVPTGRVPVSANHGLGTFAHLAEDVLHPPFADLVCCRHGSGWRVGLLRCQDALNLTVDTLVDARQAHRAGPHADSRV